MVIAPRPRLAFRLGQAWEQAALPALAVRAGARMILSPANLAPVAWPRNAVVIHDVAALRRPDWYSPGYVAWQRRVLPAVARAAKIVITPSEFSRAEVVELLDAAPDRVTAIPGGVDERFSPAADAAGAAAALGLERGYALTVATAGARKNLGALDAAAERLDALGLDLVVAGGGRAYLPAGGPTPRLHALGYVREALLPGLYAGARAFVLPSLHEGFGLTCLEAMAAGVPVVAADRGALPETCGDAALLVDPEDPDAIAAALERTVSDASVRERLVTAGARRARELSWERTARAVDARLARVSADDESR